LGKFAGTVVVIALILVGMGAQPAAAGASGDRSGGDRSGGHRPGWHQQERSYLALGDSIPFGFDPNPSADGYQGYPEVAAPKLKLALTNASCPGQSSSGFLSLGGTDNGCFFFRANYPSGMHTSYAGTQLDFAVSFLRSHPKTRLVTITLGANDLIICADTTDDMCASRLPEVLMQYEKNLTKILQSIRTVFNGKLVAVTYYSPDYRDPVVTGSLIALNAVKTRVIQKFRGTVADGFTAFEKVAATRGGDTCATGLLIRPDPNGPCDKHASRAGAKLLADTLVAAINCDPVYRDTRNREDSLVGAGS
jgi:lysophospholipase L1-like esterase